MTDLTNTNKIFDLQELKDIPPELKKMVNRVQINANTRKVLALFELKNILSIDEILIGLYRCHNIIQSRVWLSSVLYNLAKRKSIKRIKGKRGAYERTN